MQFIIAIVLLAVFMSVAPKFFKWLLMIDISICIGWYIFLRVLAFIYDAGRGGANAGMFADDAVIFVLAAFENIAIPSRR